MTSVPYSSSVPHSNGISRSRSLLRAVMALLCLLLAMLVARHGAAGLADSGFIPDRLIPLVQQAMLAFLLLLGYAGLGSLLDRQTLPIAAQGLPLRKGWRSETALGMGAGWSFAVVAIIPLALIGGIAIHLDLSAASWKWFVADAGFFALTALVEEVAFRGYGFQRLRDALGPSAAVILFAGFYAGLQGSLLGATHLSMAVGAVFSGMLSIAYLRTRALWVGWGLNFAWKASRALLFGLAVSGNTAHSPIVTGDPMGPFWLTGGGFGLESSWWAFVLLVLGLPVVYRITRDLDFIHNAPMLISSGIPVDLDAAGKQQHEAATRTAGTADAESAANLIQIAPVVAGIPPPTAPPRQ